MKLYGLLYNPNNLVPYGATLYLNNLIFDHKLHLLLVYTFHLAPILCFEPSGLLNIINAL